MTRTFPEKAPLSLYICSWAHGIGGGAARMETSYMKYFDRKKINPQLISLVPRKSTDRQYDNSLNVICLENENKFEQLVKILLNADIVQFQGSFDPLVCEAARAARVPLVIEVLHNVEKGALFEGIDMTICVSQAVAAMQDESTRHITIHNGIDTEEFAFPLNRKFNNHGKDKIIFLQVGNRSKLSVHLDELAAELSRNVPNLEFWIAGREQNFQSYDNIKFFGVVDSIQELYQAADYLVFFSPNEPFGLAAIEAMSCGCIPVLSKNKAFLDIVTEGYDGYMLDTVTKDSAVKLLSSIILEHDSEATDSIRKNARNTVRDKFSIQSCIKKHEDLYLEMYRDIQDKKRRRSHTWMDPEPTGDAVIGECVFAFHSGNLDLVYKGLRKICDKNLTISHRLCLETAYDLFQLACLNNETDISIRFIRHIVSSDPATASEALQKWLTASSKLPPCPDYLDEFENIFLNHAITDRQLGLQYAEFLLLNNYKGRALTFLEQATEKSNAISELSEYYASWLEKTRALQT